MQAKYVAPLQSIRGVLPFVIIRNKIYFLLKLQGDTPKVLCSIFENTFTFHEDNQGAVTLAVSLSMRSHTKYIAIKYPHFRIFFTDGDIEIQHIDIK